MQSNLRNSQRWSAYKSYENRSIKNSKIKDVDFTGANLSDVNFSGAKLKNADFTGAILNNVNFTSADLYHADFVNSDLSNVDLIGTNLKLANFEDIFVCGKKLKGTFNTGDLIGRLTGLFDEDSNKNSEKSMILDDL